jgi:hypothetical protein
MWVAVTDLPTAVSHPFYRRLNTPTTRSQLPEHHQEDEVLKVLSVAQ